MFCRSRRWRFRSWSLFSAISSSMMNPELMERARRNIRAWARWQPEIARVYLFGFRIRGHCKDGSLVRPDSDLNIAVELKIDEPHRHLQHGWM